MEHATLRSLHQPPLSYLVGVVALCVWSVDRCIVGMVLKVRTPLPIDNNLFNVEGRLADRLRMGVCLEGG